MWSYTSVNLIAFLLLIYFNCRGNIHIILSTTRNLPLKKGKRGLEMQNDVAHRQQVSPRQSSYVFMSVKPTQYLKELWTGLY